jgi:hypothetical protein
MASLYPYTFNGTSRLRNDNTDKSQQTVMNTKFNNYMLSTYFSDSLSNDHVTFATKQPAMMFTGSNGGASAGVNAFTVDVDSQLNIKKENARALEKLSLQQRPFLTIPYLGRGSCDTVLESQLKQGDIVANKKSVSTITEQSFMNNQMYPLIDSIKDTITNPKFLVQESALDGWTRGGSATREEAKSKGHLPADSGY